jgi:hypothetical protein
VGSEHGPGLGVSSRAFGSLGAPGALGKDGGAGEAMAGRATAPSTDWHRDRVQLLCECQGIVEEETQVSRAARLAGRGEDLPSERVVSLGNVVARGGGGTEGACGTGTHRLGTVATNVL